MDLLYLNVHSANFPAGEIRGQFGLSPSLSSIQFNATSYFVGEGAGSLAVTVTRTGNTSNAVTINYATSNGTATSPTDYTNASGSLQFAAGETVKTFVVPIIDDGLVERTETINVVLSLRVRVRSKEVRSLARSRFWTMTSLCFFWKKTPREPQLWIRSC